MKPPLIMPSSGVAQQQFEPSRVDYGAPEASGRMGGVQAGWPLWMGIWTIGKIGADRSDEWRSFVNECRGGTRAFYASDLGRPYPKAHLAGFSRMTTIAGAPFTGAASSWSQSIDGNDDQLLTLNGLPAGLTLGTGDYVGFKWTAASSEVAGLQWRAKVRVIRGGGGIANSSGVLAGVKVEPAIPSCVPSGAVAHLDNPCCVMRQVVDQTRLDSIDRRLAIRGGTIVGIQDLRG